MRNGRYIKIDSLSYITAIAYVTITYRIVKFFIWEFLINIKLAIHHHRILQCTFAVGQNKSLVGKSIRCYDFERLPWNSKLKVVQNRTYVWLFSPKLK